MINLTNEEIFFEARKLAIRINKTIDKKEIKLYGVPRGGIPVVYALAFHLPFSTIVDKPENADVIIDDIVDSGETKIRYENQYGKKFFGLFEKQKEWLHFPWETKDELTPVYDNILRIEQFLDSANEEETLKTIEEIKNILTHYETKE